MPSPGGKRSFIRMLCDGCFMLWIDSGILCDWVYDMLNLRADTSPEEERMQYGLCFPKNTKSRIAFL
jgi:hypothetical protein